MLIKVAGSVLPLQLFREFALKFKSSVRNLVSRSSLSLLTMFVTGTSVSGNFGTMSERKRDSSGNIIRRFGLARSIRRPYDRVSGVRKDLNALYSKMKQTQPLHIKQFQVGSGVTSIISTTVQGIDIGSTIVQGDAYEDRHGTKITIKRLKGMFVTAPGSTQVQIEPIRVTIVRAQVGLTGANLVSSMNITTATPADNPINRVVFDRYYQVMPTAAAVACQVKFNIPLNHVERFTGGGAGTTTGETYYVVLQSGVATGTLAPTLRYGNFEVWFTP